jgi:imidazoleglycerol-phosphate dehydratase
VRPPRKVAVRRETGETKIAVTLDLDGTGELALASGVGFFDHMLAAFGRHALFDLAVSCEGDTWVDDHHSVEDVGIVLGQALKEALGSKAGIVRFASATIPMDEALVLAAVDISGRGALYWDVPITAQKVGTFDVELAQEFFIALAREAGITLHVRKIAGENAHHILEGCFKAVARALRAAVAHDPRQPGVPSTKGMLA